jgi:hypothetical protein
MTRKRAGGYRPPVARLSVIRGIRRIGKTNDQMIRDRNRVRLRLPANGVTGIAGAQARPRRTGSSRERWTRIIRRLSLRRRSLVCRAAAKLSETLATR